VSVIAQPKCHWTGCRLLHTVAHAPWRAATALATPRWPAFGDVSQGAFVAVGKAASPIILSPIEA
jgi:hypothetical protein